MNITAKPQTIVELGLSNKEATQLFLQNGRRRSSVVVPIRQLPTVITAAVVGMTNNKIRVVLAGNVADDPNDHTVQLIKSTITDYINGD